MSESRLIVSRGTMTAWDCIRPNGQWSRVLRIPLHGTASQRVPEESVSRLDCLRISPLTAHHPNAPSGPSHRPGRFVCLCSIMDIQYEMMILLDRIGGDVLSLERQLGGEDELRIEDFVPVDVR